MEGGERMRGSPLLLLPRSVSTEAKRDELLMAPFPVGTAKTNQILDRFPLMTRIWLIFSTISEFLPLFLGMQYSG